MSNKHYAGALFGLPAIIWLGYLTSWQIALAIFLVMWANNLSQSD